MNVIGAKSYPGMNGVTLDCYPGNPITTVAMTNTNKYAVRVSFTNGTVPSEVLMVRDETKRFDFALVKCSASLVVLKKVSKA